MQEAIGALAGFVSILSGRIFRVGDRVQMGGVRGDVIDMFVRTTDNYMELSARFVVPVRTARSVKDDLTRRVHDRLAQAGIAIGWTTQDVTITMADGDSSN